MRRGFSLAEILVGLGLVSVVAITLLLLIPSVMKGTRDAGQRATAAKLADSALEGLVQSGASLGLISLGMQTLNNTEYVLNATVEAVTPDIPVQNVSNGNASPSQFPGFDPNSARHVTLRVGWTESGNQKRQYIIRRLIFVGS